MSKEDRNSSGGLDKRPSWIAEFGDPSIQSVLDLRTIKQFTRFLKLTCPGETNETYLEEARKMATLRREFITKAPKIR